MKKNLMDRERWVGGTGLLLSLLQDDLAIAKAIRARNYRDLHAAALIASEGVSPTLAMTDPAQYKALREATTLFFLKGYRCLNIGKLASLSQERSRAAAPPADDPKSPSGERLPIDVGAAAVP